MEDRKQHAVIAPAPPPLPAAPPVSPNVPGAIPRISTASRPAEALQLVRCFWCEFPHPGRHPLAVCPACTARYASMRSREMSGSFPLSDKAIDDAVTRTSPGNYALGYMEDDTFHVFFVGRSDSNVRKRLHEWVGMPSRYERYASSAKASWGVHRRRAFPVNAPALAAVGNAETSYTRFAFSYARSAEAAFEEECRSYDDFGGSGVLDNEAPPTFMELREPISAQA